MYTCGGTKNLRRLHACVVCKQYIKEATDRRRDAVENQYDQPSYIITDYPVADYGGNLCGDGTSAWLPVIVWKILSLYVSSIQQSAPYYQHREFANINCWKFI